MRRRRFDRDLYRYFSDVGEPTEVTVRMIFESAALRNQFVKDHETAEGLRETLGRLTERLQAQE